MQIFRQSLFLTLLFFLFCLSSYGVSKGTVAGRVIDLKSQKPVSEVMVSLIGTQLFGTSDENGYFRIDSVPTKTYNLKASLLGYKEIQKFDVIVTTGAIAEVNFEMEEKSLELKEVNVTASAFKKTKETPMSIQTLSQQEIKSYPGGNNDVAKVVQSLPGVSGSVGFRNDVIIRGGAPNENVYYLDNIEIPNINHFATQGSAGGPVGLLNVTFIEDVTLASSAFNSKYDNVVSGVLQFKQRTGNKDRTQANFRIGASEVAATVEGPFKKGSDKLTYIASVRRSYLQFLFKVIGLPFLPDYYDYQYKFNYKINPKTELSFIGIGAIDDFSKNKKDGLDADKRALLDGLATLKQYSANTGFNLKRLLPNGQWNTALSFNHLKNNRFKYQDDIETPNNLRFNFLSRETEIKLRSFVEQYLGEWKINYGINLIQGRYATQNYLNIPETKDSTGKVVSATQTSNFNTEINLFRYGASVQASRSFFKEKLDVSLGVRTDMNTFMKDGNNPLNTLSPRASISYNFVKNFFFNASFGRYFKIPPYTMLGYQSTAQNNALVNKDSKYIQSYHYTTGFEWQPTRSTKISVEGFYKDYYNYPVSVNDSISIANLGGNFGVLGNEAIKSVGRGKTYGIEFFFQQKFTKNFYGILAYTLYRSQFTGFDTKKYIPSAWDNKNLISFTGGYKLPRNFEIGMRFRLFGGGPYTPYNVELSRLTYTKVGTGTLDYSQFNQLRLKGYYTGDFRIDKKWNLKKVSLDLYIDIQNFLNTVQPQPDDYTLQRNDDGSFKGSNGSPFNGSNGISRFIPGGSGSLLPTIGLIIEL